MNHIEALEILVDCVNRLTQGRRGSIVEVIYAPKYGKHFYSIYVKYQGNILVETEMELFFAAHDLNLGLVKKAIYKKTAATSVIQFKDKPGFFINI